MNGSAAPEATCSPERPPTAAAWPVTSRVVACPQADLPRLMHAVLAEVVSALPAIGASIVTSVGAIPRFRTWSTTGADAAAVDRAQERADRSPAVAAVQHWPNLISGRLRSDPRWNLEPLTLPAAVHSLAAVPLPATERTPAVLCIYGSDDALLQPAATDLLGVLAPDLAAAVCLVRARQDVTDLQVALASNRAIGAAIGITMAARRLTYDQATDLLNTSNRTNTRLTDLADTILHTGVTPQTAASPPPRPHPTTAQNANSRS